MKISRFTKLFVFSLIFVAALVAAVGAVKDRDCLYQVSVLGALKQGDYDGSVTLAEIRQHGDFGLGTFNRLDGEGIELGAIFYQVSSDGSVRRVNARMKSPFAMATFFDPDKKFSLSRTPDYRALQVFIDSRLVTRNIPYAIKIEGVFSYIKARSVPAQNKPYPILAEVVKGQSVFEFRNIEGTLVGFRMPDYAKDINMPGYHLHFISRDKTKGGHVLECAVANAQASLDSTSRLTVVLPVSPEFYRLDLSMKPAGVPGGEEGN
jgi:acetolactate decarboxylase